MYTTYLTLLLITRVVRVQPKSVPIKIKWNWPAWMRSFSFLFLLPPLSPSFFLLSLSFFYLNHHHHVHLAMLSWFHVPYEFRSSLRDRRDIISANSYFDLFDSPRYFIRSIKPRSNRDAFSLYLVFHLIRYVYRITNFVILSPEYGRTLKIAYFRSIGGGKYTIKEERDKRSILDQVFNRVVYQTHLPTTIARGCAGFLSWDEERIRLISACRPVIIRECEKGGPDLCRSRKLLKMYDGIWTWLATLRF